jgi:carbonic anhydrase/acetyltransferase-like protein (isoleucine patch superfamily)
MIYELDGQKPDLPEEGRYWVAPSAAVIGRVRLKTDCSVWFGAVLRGDNEWIELGDRSQIQDNSTLHTDLGFPITIGPDCVIGHNVILHGCSIGAHTLIGMGAIILNGAHIGDNCLVGAGALVTEGKTFPAGVADRRMRPRAPSARWTTRRSRALPPAPMAMSGVRSITPRR